MSLKTGIIFQVIRYNGKVARVRLDDDSVIVIECTHRPRLGDHVVEGELSCNCCSLNG